MPKWKRLFTRSHVNAQKKKAARTDETEQQEQRLLRNWKRVQQRRSQSEKQRTISNENMQAIMRSIWFHQSADRREQEDKENRVKMASILKQRLTKKSLELQAFHCDSKKKYEWISKYCYRKN